MAFDGSSVKYLVQFETNTFINTFRKLEQSNPDIRKNKNDFATAEVRRGELPFPEVQFFSQLWFAYASHCFLSNKLGGQIKPPWPTVQKIADHPAWAVAWNGANHSHFPHLPESAVFLSNGTNFRATLNGFEPIKCDAPFDSGYEAGNFKASLFTNVNGVSLPREFVFSIHAPKPKAISKDDIYVASIWRCKAEILVDDQLESNPTEVRVTMATYVTDRRFEKLQEGMPPLNYEITNQWYETNHAVLARAYHTQRALFEAQRHPGRWIVSRATLFILINALIVFSVVAYKWSKRGRKKRLEQ